MRIQPLITICLLLGACAMPVKPPASAQPAAIEYYKHPHSELDIQKGSSAWEKLPEDEKAKHDDEEGTFADVDDVLILQPRAKDTLAFCVAHTGRFLHACGLSGIATKSAHGDYEYREMMTNSFDEPVECVLTIHRTMAKISISDESENETNGYHSCKNYCGAHASFGDGIEFELSEKYNDSEEIAEAMRDNGGCPLPQ